MLKSSIFRIRFIKNLLTTDAFKSRQQTVCGFSNNKKINLFDSSVSVSPIIFTPLINRRMEVDESNGGVGGGVSNGSGGGVVDAGGRHPPRQNRLSSESKIKIIGTHSGTFHCDEVLAVSMLKLLPEYKDAQIVRTRDEEILKTCDIVVDVGSVFDPETLRFDHHQKTFQHSMSSLRPGKPWVTRLSSAGLVYVHYGEEIIAHILEKRKDDEIVAKLFDKIYVNFIEEIDAIDNGIAVSDGPLKYRMTTNLSSRVSHFNSSWRDGDTTDEMDMMNFTKAMELVRSEFLDKVHQYATDWWEAYSIVATAVEDRFEVDDSGFIIEFPKGGVPWKDHLKDIEEETGIRIAFVIYHDKRGNMWRVQGVPVEPESFALRVPLHRDWRGLREKELEEISRIPTIKFVHASGFIGGASDRDAVVKMARLSLAEVKEW